MKKGIIIFIISILEIYGTTICGYFYGVTRSDLLLGLLIMALCICVISSIVFVKILTHKEPPKPNNCPYFIDKDEY